MGDKELQDSLSNIGISLTNENVSRLKKLGKSSVLDTFKQLGAHLAKEEQAREEINKLRSVAGVGYGRIKSFDKEAPIKHDNIPRPVTAPVEGRAAGIVTSPRTRRANLSNKNDSFFVETSITGASTVNEPSSSTSMSVMADKSGRGRGALVESAPSPARHRRGRAERNSSSEVGPIILPHKDKDDGTASVHSGYATPSAAAGKQRSSVKGKKKGNFYSSIHSNNRNGQPFTVDSLRSRLHERYQDWRKTFKSFPIDIDGSVNSDKLKNHFDRKGIKITKEAWGNIVNELDPVHTGQIQYDDFVKLMDPPTTQSLPLGDNYAKQYATYFTNKQDEEEYVGSNRDSHLHRKRPSPEKHRTTISLTQRGSSNKEATRLLTADEKSDLALQSGIFDRIHRLYGSESNNIRRLFLKVPHKYDGVVSTEDLCEEMSSLGLIVNENDKSRFASLVDPYAKGVVSFQNFSKAIDGGDVANRKFLFSRHSTVQHSHEPKNLEEHRLESLKSQIGTLITADNSVSIRDCFRRLDGDKDGVVSVKDVKSYLASLNVNVADEDLRILIDQSGANDNGDMEITHLTKAFLTSGIDNLEAKYKSGSTTTERRGRGTTNISHFEANMTLPPAEHVKCRKSVESVATLDLEHITLPNNVTQELTVDDRKSKKLVDDIASKIAQKRKNIRQSFFEINCTRTGHLSYPEFRVGLNRLGLTLNDEDFSLLVRRIDHNGDRYIDYEEFAKAVKGDHPSHIHDETHVVSFPEDAYPFRHASIHGGRGGQMKSNDAQRAIEAEGYNSNAHSGSVPVEDKQIIKRVMDVQEAIAAKKGTLRSIYTRMNKDSSQSLSKENLYEGLLSLGVQLNPKSFEDFCSSGLSAVDKVYDDLDFKKFKLLMAPRGLGKDTRDYAFLQHENLSPKELKIAAAGQRVRRESTENPASPNKKMRAASIFSSDSMHHSLNVKDSDSVFDDIMDVEMQPVVAGTHVTHTSPVRKLGPAKSYRDSVRSILNVDTNVSQASILISPRKDITAVLGPHAHKRTPGHVHPSLVGCGVPGEIAEDGAHKFVPSKVAEVVERSEKKYKVLHMKFEAANLNRITVEERENRSSGTNVPVSSTSTTDKPSSESLSRAGGMTSKEMERLKGRGKDNSRSAKFKDSSIFSDLQYPAPRGPQSSLA